MIGQNHGAIIVNMYKGRDCNVSVFTLTYGSDVPPISNAGNSEHWIAVTFKV